MCLSFSICHPPHTWLLSDSLIWTGLAYCENIPLRINLSTVCDWYCPSDDWSASSFSLTQETNFKDPVKALSKEEMENMNLKYYNPEIHKASFVLPEFARKVNKTLYSLMICTHLNASQNSLNIDYISTSFFLKHWQVLEAWPAPTDVNFLPGPQITNKQHVLRLLHLLITVQHHWRE